jgi:hypothetical protein
MTPLRRAVVGAVVASLAAADIAAVAGAVLLVQSASVADVVTLPARAAASTSRARVALPPPEILTGQWAAEVGAASRHGEQRRPAAPGCSPDDLALKLTEC